jgi:prophage antirepressor-like protein
MDDQQIIQFEPKEPNRNKIQVFTNPQFGEIRTAGTPDNPLFCLADLCRVLEIGNPSDAKSRLKKDGVVLTEVIDSIGRKQSVTFINEQNLYKLIMRSDKPQAEPFQDWVCGEVLPSIRKHGAYLPNLPDFSNPAAAARAWAEQYERNEQLAAQNKQQTLLIEQKDNEIEEFKAKYSELISQLKVKDDEIKILKDADEFGKNYIEADGTMTFDVACQYIGFGSHIKMRRWLESGDGHPKVIRVLRSVNGKPEYGTYSPFTEKGWFKLKPNVIIIKGEPKQAPGTLRITTLGVAGVKIMYERWKKRIQKESNEQ